MIHFRRKAGRAVVGVRGVVGLLVGVWGFMPGPALGDTGDLLHELFPPAEHEALAFGLAVAIDGGFAVVGDSFAGEAGLAYVYDVNTGALLNTLVPENGVFGDGFGSSASISGTTALIGAPGDSEDGQFAGAAYLFDIVTGNQLHKLTANEAQSRDLFGTSVSISGNNAIVGAIGADDEGPDSGAAYLFDVATGEQRRRLVDDVISGSDQFGLSVAVHGDKAVVGERGLDVNDPGRAFVYDAVTGDLIVELITDDRQVLDMFGSAVAITGNTALVGAPLNSDEKVFVFDATTGEELGVLRGDDTTISSTFGSWISSDGTTVAILDGNDDDVGQDRGAVHLFDLATGLRIDKIVPEEGADIAAIDDGVAVIGSVFVENSRIAGAAYLFSVIPEPSAAAVVILGVPVWLRRRGRPQGRGG